MLCGMCYVDELVSAKWDVLIYPNDEMTSGML